MRKMSMEERLVSQDSKRIGKGLGRERIGKVWSSFFYPFYIRLLSFCDPILFLSIYSFSALVMISVSVFGLGHFLWLSNHFFRFINSILNIGICPCVLMSIVTKTKEILTKIFLKWYIEVIFGTKLGENHCTLYFCIFVLTHTL